MFEKYETIVGLEIHAQLNTKSKAFAGDSTLFGQKPNTQISVITLAHPGTLPKTNKQMVESAIKMGLATHCHINQFTLFARKNYFYPDLPKGYQLTQDKNPICENGFLNISLKNNEIKKIRIQRIHLEEDAGKLLHLAEEKDSLIDFNRAGVPLIEIVSQPDIRSGEEASTYMQMIRQILKYLNICDGNMEEGSLRCDANVSVRLKGTEKLGTRVEIKNLNSFRFLQKAIDFEAKRQIQLIEAGRGNEIVQETRSFDPQKEITTQMREKESLNDYRYFPEPDLAPLQISDEWLKNIQQSMPILPQTFLQKMINDYKLSQYQAQLLTEFQKVALFFEEIIKINSNYKHIANFIIEVVRPFWIEKDIENTSAPISALQCSELITLILENKVSHQVATQKIFPLLVKNTKKMPSEIAKEENLWLENNQNELQAIIEQVLANFTDKVKEYKNGKKGLLGMFVGEVMKKTKGKADPKLVNQLVNETLSK
jgi:aspartyl-tRNA(Asn)/glutamyl-tRNA(Gln) amidotransferase subunit B